MDNLTFSELPVCFVSFFEDFTWEKLPSFKNLKYSHCDFLFSQFVLNTCTSVFCLVWVKSSTVFYSKTTKTLLLNFKIKSILINFQTD